MDQRGYPVRFAVDYPDRPLNRLTTALRIFYAIPILIVLGTVSGSAWQSTTDGDRLTIAGAGASSSQGHS